jgi:hypothetical protein
MEEEVATSTINIGETILNTINSLCGSLFNSIDKNIMPELDKLLFLDSDLIQNTSLERIVGDNLNTGLLVLANSLLTAFVLYYAIRRFTSYYSGTEVESPYQFIIKTLVIAILVSFSLTICSSIVSFTHEISSFVCDLGHNITGQSINFQTMINKISSKSSSDFNIFSFDGILSSMISISSFSLMITFAFRYVLTKILVMLSPFAILCLINKPTSGLFRSWLKSFFSLLLIQVIISLIMLLVFVIIKENSASMFGKLLLIGSTYALLKSNQFVKEFINGTGISTDFSSGISGLRSIIR